MFQLTDEQARRIRDIRHECRVSEGGGGMCHWVSEALILEFGWGRCAGSYTDLKGDVITEAHYWNLLRDGTLIDGTADQFGEGHDIRVIHPGDPEIQRYRLEWYHDWNPDVLPEQCSKQLGYSTWRGELDGDQANRLRRDRGDGWWLTSQAAYDQYKAQRARYRQAHAIEVAQARMAHSGRSVAFPGALTA